MKFPGINGYPNFYWRGASTFAFINDTKYEIYFPPFSAHAFERLQSQKFPYRRQTGDAAVNAQNRE
jgi:hypothetical protein